MTTFRIAITFVGTTLLLCVLGIIGIVLFGPGDGRPIPDILQNVASGALAGLIGLLVRPDTATRADRDGVL